MRVVRPVRGKLCLQAERSFYLIEKLEGEAVVIRPIEAHNRLALGREVNVNEIKELIAHGAKS